MKCPKVYIKSFFGLNLGKRTSELLEDVSMSGFSVRTVTLHYQAAIGAEAAARRILDAHWDCIEEISRDLLGGGSLLNAQVISAIRRAPSRAKLLAECEVLTL